MKAVGDEQSNRRGLKDWMYVEFIVLCYYAVSIIILQKVGNCDEDDTVPAVASDLLEQLRQNFLQNNLAE